MKLAGRYSVALGLIGTSCDAYCVLYGPKLRIVLDIDIASYNPLGATLSFGHFES